MGARAWVWLGAGVALLGAGAAFADHGAVGHLLEPPRDARFAGAAVPEEHVRPWLEARAESFAEQPLRVTVRGEHFDTSVGALGVVLDVALAERALLALPRPSAPWPRLRRALRPPLEPREVPVPWRLDRARAQAWLAALAEQVRREPEDARLDVRAHRRVAERPGVELDVAASLALLERHLSAAASGNTSSEVSPLGDSASRNPALPDTALPDTALPDTALPDTALPDGGLELPTLERAARVTLADLPNVDVSQVLASYETDFRKKGGARSVNIQRAADLLDGSIILPGETFSFNQVVGERTLLRGFVDAPVIVEDEMEAGVGGGVCQVATTLHAAAVFGHLQMVERRSHSRPSGYAPLGLDATVIDGKVDLRFRNPYPVPLLVHASLPSRYRIRVELLGAPAPGRIEHSYAVIQRHDFYRRIVEKPQLSPGSFEKTQDGGYGYDTVSHVQLERPGGAVEHHRYTSKYYPVPEVFWVGPRTPLDRLPPLPEGASHVEM